MGKRLITLFILATLTISIYAQSEMSVFSAVGRGGVASTFVTDYQALGINVSNLGWKDQFDTHVTIGFMELGASVYSNALKKDELKNSFLTGDPSALSSQEKEDAAQQLINKGLALNIDFMPLGLAINLNGAHIGGFAYNSRLRITSFIKLNDFTSNLLFRGFNYSEYFDTIIGIGPNPDDTFGINTKNPKLLSELLGDTRINLSIYAEHSIGYGRTIYANDEIGVYGGVGIKFIQGFGALDIGIKDGKLRGFASNSPIIGIDYSNISTPSLLDSTARFKPAGKGTGYEFAFNIEYKEKIRVAMSVVDMGSINWTGNVVTLEDHLIDSINFNGINSLNMLAEIQELVGGGSIFKYEGNVSRKEKLPTKFRMGASYKVFSKLEIGYDLIVPLNNAIGNYQNPIFALGGTITPIKALNISSGFSVGGNYGFNVPVGVVIGLGQKRNFEFGLATRDIITYFGQNKPNISAGLGVLRFRF